MYPGEADAALEHHLVMSRGLPPDMLIRDLDSGETRLLSDSTLAADAFTPDFTPSRPRKGPGDPTHVQESGPPPPRKHEREHSVVRRRRGRTTPNRSDLSEDMASTGSSGPGEETVSPLPFTSMRVNAHKKSRPEFKLLRKYQRIPAHIGPIRVLAFSLSGFYLASGGADGRIHIWEVTSSGLSDNDSAPPVPPNIGHGAEAVPEPRAARYQSELYLRYGKPFRTYTAHTMDVVAMSWSKNEFLLTGSLDKTMRLWHPSSEVCLRRFPHPDYITTISFHPQDEQICVSGMADGRLLMWHVKERKRLSEADADEMVTASCICPNGKTLLVGTVYGRCKLYNLFDEIQGDWQLLPTTQVDIRSERRKNKKGAKISGIVFSPTEENAVMISSNDSRLRLYHMDDKSLVNKYLGHVCNESQLAASFSPCGNYVLSGSENRHVFVWDVDGSPDAATGKPHDDSGLGRKARNVSYESFSPHDHDYVSAAVFGRTRYFPQPHARDSAPGAGPTSGMVVVTGSEQGDICVFTCP